MNRLIPAFIIVVLIISGTTSTADAQVSSIDSLKTFLNSASDTLKVKTLIDIGDIYEEQDNKEQALSNYFEALKTAEVIQNKEWLFQSLIAVAHFYENLRQHNVALEYALKAQKIAEEQNNKQNLYDIYDLLGGLIYFNENNFTKAFEYGEKMMRIAEAIKDKSKILYMLGWFGDTYRIAQNADSAILMYSKKMQLSQELGDKKQFAYSLQGIALAYTIKKDYEKAIDFYLQAIKIGESEHFATGNFTLNLSQVYFDLSNYEKALFYAESALNSYKGSAYIQMMLYNELSEIYAAKGDYKQAYFNRLNSAALKDSLKFAETRNKIDSIQVTYKTEKQNKEIDFLNKQNELQAQIRNALIAGVVLIIIIALLIANKYRQKKQSELTLNIKNNELTLTLSELKAAQSQLIQAEKMASLGELTAGIAHEIQNPLNFVNNFSEVNKEMIVELKDEIEKGNYDEVKIIANDIEANEEKINHHGKRADAIVKGMLQHSRSSTGKKELTDINALCDEYLRLSYHGLRAKDKNFNANFKTDFDESIGNINIIPQDIGRVILNLINNSFYAVAERKKQQPQNYEPSVLVSTKKANDKIEITVADNGNGIPQNIVDKIFQPFFTTKPTGQGTGLGLSMSYDIIKAHGGEIKVETKEGAGTAFIILLPFS